MLRDYDMAWLDAEIDGEPVIPAIDQQIEYQRYLQRLELVMIENRSARLEREARNHMDRTALAHLAMSAA